MHFSIFGNSNLHILTKTIIIASKSPVKIEAVKIGFKKVFPDSKFIYENISVPSGVSDQPKTNEETFQGALNRCKNAFDKLNNGDYWIGIEGGIQKRNRETEAFAWVYIKTRTKIGKARTASFFLPEKISKLIEQGIELGEADDIVFGLKDSKKQN